MVSALVRGRVWYLSMFFVLPGDQGRGLGRALLERALAYGEARGAEIRCTLATLDPRAQARYVMAGMAPRWPIYRLDGDAAAVTRLRALAGLDPREQELPCDPGAAEKLTAEVFGHGRADDLAHWRGDGGAAVAIERGGEIAAFAYRRGERIGPAAGRDETALLQAVAAAGGGKCGRRGKGDDARARRLRFPARSARRQRLSRSATRRSSWPRGSSRWPELDRPLGAHPVLNDLRGPPRRARSHPPAVLRRSHRRAGRSCHQRLRGRVAPRGAANRPRGGRGGRAGTCRPRARPAACRVHRGHRPAPRPGGGPSGHRVAVERGRRARPQCLRRARRLGRRDARAAGTGQSGG